MTDESAPGPIDWVTRQKLIVAAAVLTYLVAAVHLFHPSLGFGRLVLMLSLDPGLLAADPRPVLFVLSGVALVLAIPVASLGFPTRVLYGLGIGLMAIYVIGYFAWHFTGHGGFLPSREPLYHGLAPHEAVISHLTGDVLAAVAVTAELLLAAILVLLLRTEQSQLS